jgi:hypothetical protein
LNGSSCDDGDPNTTGETCSDGACLPPCPCFTIGDLNANGTTVECGQIPGFPNLVGVIWANGGRACSGELCAAGPGTLTCAISTPINPLYIEFITPEVNASCQALLLSYCGNPSFTEGLTSEKSREPFISE